MSSHHPTSTRSFIWRGDLVRARLFQAAYSEDRQHVLSLIDSLGFTAEEVDSLTESQVLSIGDSIRAATDIRGETGGGIVEDEASVQLEAQFFWVPTRFQSPVWKALDREGGPEDSAPGGDAKEDPVVPVPWRPLATWPQLRNRLQPLLERLVVSRKVDEKKLVEALCRCESISTVPRLVRRRSPDQVHIIADRSDRCIPFFRDQQLVAERITRDLARNQCRFSVCRLPEMLKKSSAMLGASLRIGSSDNQNEERREQPVAASTVLILGDLAFLERHKPFEVASWVQCCRRWRQQGVKIYALLPYAIDQVPREFVDLVEPIAWQGNSIEYARDAQREKLLRAIFVRAFPALQLEPGLLRELRVMGPDAMDASLESDVWQHDWLASNHSEGARNDRVVVKERLRDEFEQLDDQTKGAVLSIQRRFRHMHGYQSLWQLELLNLTNRTQRLIKEYHQDAEGIRRLLTQYEAYVNKDGMSNANHDQIAWFSRRASQAALNDEINGRSVRLIQRVFQENEEIHDATRIEEIKSDGVLRTVGLMGQVDGVKSRVIQSTSELPNFGANLVKLQSTKPLIEYHVPELDAAVRLEREFWKLGRKPDWVSDYGTDKYGAWCEIQILRHDRTAMVTQRFRWIEPGDFMMGSAKGDNRKDVDESPQHRVTLTQGFWIADSPVTQEMWMAISGGHNPSYSQGDAKPVEKVSWEDCQGWIRRFSEQYISLTISLPTEAQWEYACRAESTTAYFFGNDTKEMQKYGWSNINSGNETHPVKQLLPNRWGLYDMHGNVWEWCSDWYAPYSGFEQSDPNGAASGIRRVIRGGCWVYPARYLRSACRSMFSPGQRSSDLGFRLVASGQGAAPRERAILPVKERIAGREPSVHVRVMEKETTRRDGFWKSGNKPKWVSQYGRDNYGLWCEFQVPRHKGSGVITQRMRWIVSGVFKMGSPIEEHARNDDESPQHRVVITQGFWMADSQVTQELWMAVSSGSNPSFFKGETNPVEQVSWEDCQIWIRKISAFHNSLILSLPSEAQWEYACRAHTTSAYCFGYSLAKLSEYGWHQKNSKKRTHPVKQLKPNGWGLYDMHGNVWEWCRDWYGVYKQSTIWDPAGPEKGLYRVVRGGSWGYPSRHLRSACRDRIDPGNRYDNLGFRFMISPVDTEPCEGAMPPVSEQDAGQAIASQVTVKREEWSSSNTFWKSGTKPQWVSNYGKDQYGFWCELQLPRVDNRGVVTQRMRWIPPGTFLMGSNEVTLTQGYWLADSQVTQKLWEAVGTQNPSFFPEDANPVENISWSDCQKWLRKVENSVRELNISLPTEAQWEYACRAGSITDFCFGDDRTELPKHGWYKENSRKTTHPVKQLLPNRWGLYDMHGNVWEWCENRYVAHEEFSKVVSTPDYKPNAQYFIGPARGTHRVIRGGSWGSTESMLRSAYRRGVDPSDKGYDLGFRFLISAPGAEPNDKSLLTFVGQQSDRLRLSSTEPSYEFLRSLDLNAIRDCSYEEEIAEVDIQAYTSIRVVSDKEGYQFDQLAKPTWAVDFGSDKYGYYATIEFERVRQRMRWIPPGKFMMGSAEGADYGRGNEDPQHDVIITNGYWIFDTPCTQGLWFALMGENPSYFHDVRCPDPLRPVEQVSWKHAVEFAMQLNERIAGNYSMEGSSFIDGWNRLMFRLPTEAEWEYACRGGTTGDTHAGDLDLESIDESVSEVLNSIAWYGGNSGHNYDLEKSVEMNYIKGLREERRGGTRKVACKSPNAWGLYDMLGNVWEWCHDWYGVYPSQCVVDPTGPTEGSIRVFRGGSWGVPAQSLRSACRSGDSPGHWFNSVGFRLLSSAFRVTNLDQSAPDAMH